MWLQKSEKAKQRENICAYELNTDLATSQAAPARLTCTGAVQDWHGRCLCPLTQPHHAISTYFCTKQ